MTDQNTTETGLDTFTGHTDHVNNSGESYFGISHAASTAAGWPDPFHHGDYIAMFHDNARQIQIVEGWLIRDAAALAKDDTYLGPTLVRDQDPYIHHPYYIIVNGYDAQGIDRYMTDNPRSHLQADMQAPVKILQPLTVLELFANQLPAIVLRDPKSNPVETTSVINKLNP